MGCPTLAWEGKQGIPRLLVGVDCLGVDCLGVDFQPWKT
jgi:hypothetical protein